MKPSLTDRAVVRVPLLAAAMLALMAALYAGLQRIGWPMAGPNPLLAAAHGPLMVCGFLGTLISLERAVALRRLWAYAAPLLSGLGGLLLLAGVEGWAGPLLMTAGSAVLVAVFGALLRMHVERFVQVMGLGAVVWFASNVGWLLGAAVPQIVLGWLGFLVLTIAGERLELSRMLMHEDRVQRWFLYLAGALAAALGLAAFAHDLGVRLAGAAIVGLAVWLWRFDVARHTVRQTGLTRFVAACLLAGYAWLAVGGVLMLVFGGVTAGLAYDALLHAIFVGFVFSMIFGHAPIIFPSVLGLPIRYHPWLYVPLVLLHGSLVLRTVGDLGAMLAVRRWGGMINAVAILLYLVSMAVAALRRSDDEPIPR